MLRVLSLFSGIGAFEKALTRQQIPFELVNYCEFDKFASKSYSAVHGVPESMNLGDVSKVDTDKLPDFDLMTWGFPCQDISVAGKQRGIAEGTRSGLYYEGYRILKAKRPTYSIIENVKNLVGEGHRDSFIQIIKDIRELGYNCYWRVLNAKDFGVPQNRERIFIISIRQDIDKWMGWEGLFPWPQPFDNGLRLIDFLETKVDERYYISDEKTAKLLEQIKNDTICVDSFMIGYDGKPREYKDYAPTLSAREYKDPRNIVVPCLTPDRAEKRQNGRRFKNNGEEMFALTTQDRHGVLCINTKDENGVQPSQQDRVYSTDGIMVAQTAQLNGRYNILEPNECRCVGELDIPGQECIKRVYDPSGISPTLTTMSGGNRQPKAITGYRIRKLTPLECWRLMGFDDEDFYKAAEVNSNSQLYKQAGNSIVVNVLEEIFKGLFK